MSTAKKILFTDLDGTLLNDQKQISAINRRAIAEALDKGHKITIATGRPLQSGIVSARELGLDQAGCYMIAYNGAVIYDFSKEQICSEKFMTRSQLKYLFTEGEKAGIYVQTYSDTAIWTNKECKELQFYSKASGMPYEIHENVAEELNELPHKILMVELENSQRLLEFQQQHSEWEKKNCLSIFSTEEYLEYCPFGATKGEGVCFLAQRFGINIEDTIAIGDERNDISMIESAGIGVAMKNAKECVKESADVITVADNNHDGVAEIIYKYILT